MIKNLLLVFLSLLVSLAVVDNLLARFFPQPIYRTLTAHGPNCYLSSPILPFTLKPNCSTTHETPEFKIDITTNSLGFRDLEFPLVKPSGTYRILVVGDSFVFGHGVNLEQTFSQILEAKLQAAVPRGFDRVEVINAGFAAGASVDSYYVFLVNRLAALEPDLVIMSFFTMNDVTDLMNTRWLRLDSQGLPQAVSDMHRVVDEQGYLVSRNQPFYYRNHFLANSHTVILTGTTFQRLVAKISAKFNRPAADVKTAYHYYACLFVNRCFPEMEALFAKTNRLLKASHDLVLGQNRQFLLLIIPTDGQLDRQVWDKYGGGGFDLIDPPQPQDRLIALAKTQNICYLDLLPAFLAQKTQPLFYKLDGHFTSWGHRLAADTLYDFLKQGINKRSYC